MAQIFLEDGKVIPVTLVVSDSKLDTDLKDKKVIVTGISKGKGFAGVMKRWGFKGGQATRGQSNKPRSGGSIGSQTPGRVFKGKKMPGQLGNVRVTVKGLRIIDARPDENLLLIRGAVPGHKNSLIMICKTSKQP